MKNLSKIKLPLRFYKFLNQQRISCKSSTINTYISSLRDFNSFLCSYFKSITLSSKHIAELNNTALDHYLIYLHQQPLAPYSRVNRFLVIKKYIAWEVEQNNLPASILNNFLRSRLPKVPDYLPRPLSNETDKSLILKLRSSDNPFAKAFLLLRLTGLRISELINLTYDPILITAKNESFLKVPLGKMDNERLVPLSNEALSLILNLKNSSGLPAKYYDKNRLIRIKGHIPFVYRLLFYQFKLFTNNLYDQNIPITFHRLRHTYATTLLSAGVSIVSIMKLLGHRRIEMSLRYAQVTPTLLRNEYLKAISSIEQNILYTDQLKTAPNDISLSDLFLQIAAFIKKEIPLNKSAYKKIFRKLSCLNSSIQKLTIKNKFPIIPTL